MRNRLKLKATFGSKNSKNSPKSPTHDSEDSGLQSKLVSAPSLNNISIASPGEDFRSSVILPDLSRQFSFLARTESPDALKKQLDRLREGEAKDSLTVEEEEIVLEELRQLREARLRKRPKPTPPSSFNYNPHSGHPLRSRLSEADHPSSSFFGGHNGDHEKIRRARKSESSRSLASQDSGDTAGRSTHSRRPSDFDLTSTSPLEPTSGPSYSSAGIVNSASLSSLTSEISSRFEDFSPPVSSPPLVSRSWKRKSLLDQLSHDQLNRISNTLARIDESNSFQASRHEEEPVVMSTFSNIKPGSQPSVRMLSPSNENIHNEESGLPKRDERKHKRSASQVTADRVQGYIPGMPRPVGSRSPSTASSRFGTSFNSSQETNNLSRDSSPLPGAQPYPSTFGHVRKSSLTPSQLSSSFIIPSLTEDLDEFNTLRSSESDQFLDSEHKPVDRENELFHSARSYASSYEDSTYLVPPSFPKSSIKHLSGNTAEHLLSDDEDDDTDRFMDAPRRQNNNMSVNSRASSISGLHEPTLSTSSSSRQPSDFQFGGPGRSLFLEPATVVSSRNSKNAPRGVSHTNDRSVSSATAFHGHERFSAILPAEDGIVESRYSRAPFQVGWNYPTSDAPEQHHASEHQLLALDSPSEPIHELSLPSNRSSYQHPTSKGSDDLGDVLEEAMMEKEGLRNINRRSLALEDLQPLVSQNEIDQTALMETLSPLTKEDIQIIHQRLMQPIVPLYQQAVLKVSETEKSEKEVGLLGHNEQSAHESVRSLSKTDSTTHRVTEQPDKLHATPPLPASFIDQASSLEPSIPSASEEIIAKYHAQSDLVKPGKGTVSEEATSQITPIEQDHSFGPSGSGLSPQPDCFVNMHEPGFADNFRAKVEAATHSLKNNSTSNKPARSKSLKGKGKLPISSPQFVSTTANVISKPIVSASPTPSIPPSPADSPVLPSPGTFKNGSGLGIRFGSKIRRKKSGEDLKSMDSSPRQPGYPWGQDSLPTSPPAVPPLPSSPLLNNPTSPDNPHTLFFPPLMYSTALPQPHLSAEKAPKPKKSLRNLLRPRKSSEPRSSPSSPSIPTPIDNPFSSPIVPQTPSIPPEGPSASLSQHAPLHPKEVLYGHVSGPSTELNRESSFSSNRSNDINKNNNKKTSDDESARAMEILFDAAQKLEIDSADVSQMLQRSNSQMSSRKSHYSNRSDDHKEGLSSISRVPSTRRSPTMIETVVEDPMETSNLSSTTHLRTLSSQQSGVGRSNSVLRRTIIMPDDTRSSWGLNRSSDKDIHRSQHSGSSLLHRSPAKSQLNVYNLDNERKSFSSSQGHGRSPSMNSQTNRSSDSRPPLQKSLSSTDDSLYDLYDGEGDVRSDHHDKRQSSLTAPSDAIEVLEMSNGDVLYNVLQNLRDVQDIDDIDWDMHSEISASDPSRMSIDEPVQFTFKDRDSSIDPRRSTHKSRAPRPETKIFYSSSRQMAELIDEIAREHDQGVLQFTPSPVVSPTTPIFLSVAPHAPLSIPKRSTSINRQFLAARVSDAPSFTPSQTSSLTSMDTKLDRLMHSLE